MTILQFVSGPLGYSGVKDKPWKSPDIVFRVAYLSLQLVDLGLTLMASYCGFEELNPFVRASLASPYQIYIFKLGIPLVIAWFVPGKLLIPAIILLGGVVGWNIKELVMLAF